jgi:hypothetical protein
MRLIRLVDDWFPRDTWDQGHDAKLAILQPMVRREVDVPFARHYSASHAPHCFASSAGDDGREQFAYRFLFQSDVIGPPRAAAYREGNVSPIVRNPKQ